MTPPPSPTTVILLGTGTSVGVPVIGCRCPVCTSGHPANNRTRCSLHLRQEDLSLLIDSGPDLRQQALRESLTRVDAVFYTHAHLDHLAGFDELRAFCWDRESPLPLYAGPETHATLERMFPWAFDHGNPGYVRPDPLVLAGPVSIGGLTVTPVPVEHAGIETFGFRFDFPGAQSLAYLSDVKRIPDSSRALLGDLDILIIDALRDFDHPTHMTLREALAATGRLAPKQALFTHLAHEIGYEEVSARLPPGVSLACDGLRLHFRPGESCSMVAPFDSP